MLAENSRHMSIEEFNQLNNSDNNIYELIEGLVLMSPRPSIVHQKTLTKLSFYLSSYFDGKKCDVLNEAEIQLGDNVVVPDLFIYCDSDKFSNQRYIGSPSVVIEILSPSTAFKDLNTKMKLYEKYGIEEYWIVNTNTQTIVVHNFTQKTSLEYSKDLPLKSNIYHNLEIDLGKIFL